MLCVFLLVLGFLYGNATRMALVKENCHEYVIGFDGNIQFASAQELYTNVTVNGIVSKDQYVFYQLCIAKHMHEHEIVVDLKAKNGEVHLYGAVGNEYPQLGKADWIGHKIGDDQFRLPTYLSEFPRSSELILLYLSVRGMSEIAEYGLKVAIHDLKTNRNVKSRQEYYKQLRKQRLRRQDLFTSEL